jgi:hypothetical protein
MGLDTVRPCFSVPRTVKAAGCPVSSPTERIARSLCMILPEFETERFEWCWVIGRVPSFDVALMTWLPREAFYSGSVSSMHRQFAQAAGSHLRS